MSPYSTKNFFRHAPHELLAEYFDVRSIEFKLELTGGGRADVERLTDAWLALDEKDRRQAEVDFRDIQELATELGIANIRSLADLAEGDLVARLGALDGDYDRSFWVFLRHSEIFNNALRLLDADRLPGRSWRKRKDLSQREPGADEPTIALLRDALVAPSGALKAVAIMVTSIVRVEQGSITISSSPRITRAPNRTSTAVHCSADHTAPHSRSSFCSTPPLGRLTPTPRAA